MVMRKIFTGEMEKFFLEHQKGLTRQQLADLMKKEFNIMLNAQQISDQRRRLGVNGGKIFIPHPSRRIFTEEQEKFFIENQYGLLRDEVAELMNKTFGLHITGRQVKEQRTRLKLKTGPANLYMSRAKKSHTLFYNGHTPHNHLPVGTEVIKDDGYLWRKIDEPNKWKQLHILIWEAAHGPRPKGHKIIFLNGDRTDIRLDNLGCVTNSEMLYLNRKDLIFQEKELTEAGIQVARLYTSARSIELKKRKR